MSSTRSLRGSAALPARARMARAALSATLAAIAAAGLTAPAADADLAAVGPIDPATQLPAWFQDANGLKLGLCLDGPPSCLTTVDEFNAPDGEAFWWNAGADLASGTTSAKLVLAQEAVTRRAAAAPSCGFVCASPADGRARRIRRRIRSESCPSPRTRRAPGPRPSTPAARSARARASPAR